MQRRIRFCRVCHGCSPTRFSSPVLQATERERIRSGVLVARYIVAVNDPWCEMSKRNEVIRGTEDSDTEVELSSQELLHMSRPDVDPGGVPEHVGSASSPGAPAVRSISGSDVQASATPAETSTTGKRIGLSLGFLLAVAGGGGIYAHISQKEADEPFIPPSSLLAVQPEAPEAEPPAPLGAPVRFANPFDRSEIFEFPAGTSREEARAAVAQMLLERAAGRRAQVNARKKKH